MANQDGDAGMETMLWDINIIPNELDNGYLMLPPGVLHMSALGRFGRFTLFSPRVSHSKHLPVFCFVLCCVLGLGVFVALWCFCSLFCKYLESRILRAVLTSMTDKALSLVRLCSKKKKQAKHLWYNVDIRWSDLKDKLEVLAPTGLTREDIWRHLFLTKQRKNPYEEGCYTGEDVEDVKQKWEDKKHYFEQYKKDVPRPPCIDLDRAILGFNIDNSAAFQAIEDSKALHARRWQTKEGTYRIKRRALPDVRDAPLQDDNAAASCSDGKPRWRCWDGDYAMGYQHHP